MKKVLFIAALLAGASYANGQKVNESNVPAAVKSTFKSKCPNVTSVKWEKEDGNYEGHYDVSKTEMTTVIDPSGKFVQTEEGIAIAALPKGASDYMAKNFPGKKLKDVTKITAADGKIMYEAEVDEVDYVFDKDGNFLKKEADND